MWLTSRSARCLARRSNGFFFARWRSCRLLALRGAHVVKPNIWFGAESIAGKFDSRRGSGPLQKTKTSPFLTVTSPLQHARVRRRRTFCGGNPKNDIFTTVFGFSSIHVHVHVCQDTSEDPSSGFCFGTQLCPFRAQNPFFSLRGRILRAGPPAPLCFLFFVAPSRPLPLAPPGRVLTVKSKPLGRDCRPTLHNRRTRARSGCAKA